MLTGLLFFGLQDDFDLDMDFSKTKKKKKKKKDIDELVAEEMDKKGDKLDDSKRLLFYSLNKIGNLYIFLFKLHALTMDNGILSLVRVLIRFQLLCREILFNLIKNIEGNVQL